MDALPRLAPVSGAYASLPVAEAFNWADGATELAAGEWYLVAFRSVRAAGADEAKLDEYDERAHQEAAASPGFVHYLKGPPARRRLCMSFCLWQSRAKPVPPPASLTTSRPSACSTRCTSPTRSSTYTVRREAGGALTFEPYPVSPHSFGQADAARASTGPDLASTGDPPL